MPLLPWSSSTILLVPPKDDLPRRWVKLLLYLLRGVGFGELEADGVTILSGTTGPPLSVAGMPAVREERFRACVKALIPEPRGNDCGDCGGLSPGFWNGLLRPGDEDNEPALNG